MEPNENNASIKFYFERVAFFNNIDLMLFENQTSSTYDIVYWDDNFRKPITVPKNKIEEDSNPIMADNLFDYIREHNQELFL